MEDEEEPQIPGLRKNSSDEEQREIDLFKNIQKAEQDPIEQFLSRRNFGVFQRKVDRLSRKPLEFLEEEEKQLSPPVEEEKQIQMTGFDQEMADERLSDHKWRDNEYVDDWECNLNKSFQDYESEFFSTPKKQPAYNQLNSYFSQIRSESKNVIKSGSLNMIQECEFEMDKSLACNIVQDTPMRSKLYRDIN